MSRMFQSLDLLVLSCLFLAAVSKTGKISPPQNLTLQWINDFKPKLSWTPPQQAARNCTYTVLSQGLNHTIERGVTWTYFTILNGGSLHLSVIADCNGKQSEPAFYDVFYPELVKDLVCYLYAPKKTRCTWAPASNALELRFFYRLTSNAKGSDHQRELRECSSYIYTDGVKTGCEVPATEAHAIRILFNGTLNKSFVRNTFEKKPKDDVRPPPLEWTVTKSEDKLNINWTAPAILSLSFWKFTINYTECNVVKEPHTINAKTSYQMNWNRHCQYCMNIKAEEEQRHGGTEWSDPKCIADTDQDHDPLVYIAFIIPLVVTILAALAFICCRQNKEKIFPKIIKPADLISDIDNNNKSNLFNLHVPAEEEETCEITVIDPQLIRLDC